MSTAKSLSTDEGLIIIDGQLHFCSKELLEFDIQPIQKLKVISHIGFDRTNRVFVRDKLGFIYILSDEVWHDKIRVMLLTKVSGPIIRWVTRIRVKTNARFDLELYPAEPSEIVNRYNDLVTFK